MSRLRAAAGVAQVLAAEAAAAAARCLIWLAQPLLVLALRAAVRSRLFWERGLGSAWCAPFPLCRPRVACMLAHPSSLPCAKLLRRNQRRVPLVHALSLSGEEGGAAEVMGHHTRAHHLSCMALSRHDDVPWVVCKELQDTLNPTP